MIKFTFTEIKKEYLQPDNCPFPFVLCTMGSYGAQGDTVRPHGFEFHHLLWVVDGCGTVSVSGEKFELSRGEGFFCKRGVPHSYKRRGDTFSTAWLTFICADGVLDYFKVTDSFRFKVTSSLQTMERELTEVCRRGGTVIERSYTGYAQLCTWLADITSEKVPLHTRIRHYLEANFQKPLTLNDIAEFAGTDRFAVCHYYKQNCGVTVMEQLRRIRVAKAKHLLTFTDHSAQQIGIMCGFDSASYFGMVFKKETGLTPIEYREKHNEN